MSKLLNPNILRRGVAHIFEWVLGIPNGKWSCLILSCTTCTGGTFRNPHRWMLRADAYMYKQSNPLSERLHRLDVVASICKNIRFFLPPLHWSTISSLQWYHLFRKHHPDDVLLRTNCTLFRTRFPEWSHRRWTLARSKVQGTLDLGIDRQRLQRLQRLQLLRLRLLRMPCRLDLYTFYIKHFNNTCRI